MLQAEQFNHASPDGSRWPVACLRTPATGGRTCSAIWLPGLLSDMTSGKATHVAGWAASQGFGFTRFDYRGHGQSGGRFEDTTVSDWLADARLIYHQATNGPQVLVGSSMGGWIALLLARELLQRGGSDAERLRGLILVAPAWDMTERLMWAEFPPDVRRAVMEDGIWQRPSACGEAPYPITRRLIVDGRELSLAGRPLALPLPIRIIHGMRDADVPWQGSLELAGMLTGDDVQVTLIKDGAHRLSRASDMAQIVEALAELTGTR